MALVDRVRAVFGMRRMHFSESAPRPIDDLFRELYAAGGHVSRAEALSVPAVKRGRDLICSLATLPLETVDTQRRLVSTELLDGNIDPNVADVVTLAQTFEDLLCDGVSYWLKTAYDAFGYPVEAQHLDHANVSEQPPAREVNPLPSGIDPRSVYWVYGKPVPKSQIIRFDSPNTPLLRDGHRAIKRAVALDKAAELYANDPRPMDYITAKDVSQEPTDDELTDFFAKWRRARKKRSMAYIPGSFEYHEVQQPTPADLQLVQLQQRAALDVANLIGVDPEDLGVSTTSRTYQNDVSRRQDRINDVFATYAAAVTGRLSMDDVTWPGRKVRLDFGGYLRADPLTRSQVQLAYLAAGVVTVDEIRTAEGMPSLTPVQLAQMPAAPAPAPIRATVGEPVRAIEAA